MTLPTALGMQLLSPPLNQLFMPLANHPSSEFVTICYQNRQAKTVLNREANGSLPDTLENGYMNQIITICCPSARNFHVAVQHWASSFVTSNVGEFGHHPKEQFYMVTEKSLHSDYRNDRNHLDYRSPAPATCLSRKTTYAIWKRPLTVLDRL